MSQPWDGSKIVRSCPGTVAIGVAIVLVLAVLALVIATGVEIPENMRTQYVSLSGGTLPGYDETVSGNIAILLCAGAFVAMFTSLVALTGRRWAYYSILLLCLFGTVNGILLINRSQGIVGERPYFDLSFLPLFFLLIGIRRYHRFAQFRRYRRQLRRGEITID